jgi:excisionase family DNA binding protein
MRSRKSPAEGTQRLSVSVEEAAELLSIGRSSVFALVKEGLLHSVKVGKRRLITLDELRSFLDRQTRKVG